MAVPTKALARQLNVRLAGGLLNELQALAVGRRITLSQLVRSLVERELAAAESASGSMPDESAIREMAILVAVELVLKLQEASIPGGATLSRRLLEDAARAAIARVEMVESRLRQDAVG